MSPLSDDPIKRERQLENLRPVPENLVPGAGAWQPGDAPNLQHGGRTVAPQQSVEWSPGVQAAITDLEQRVGAELRDDAGAVHPWAVPSIEAVALQRVAAWRVDRYLADREAKGALKPKDIELSSRVTERYHRALEREALTLRSRLDAGGQAFDLAQHWAEQGDDAIDGSATDA